MREVCGTCGKAFHLVPDLHVDALRRVDVQLVDGQDELLSVNVETENGVARQRWLEDSLSTSPAQSHPLSTQY